MDNLVAENSEVFERFGAIVADSLRIDKSQITPDAYLPDLGAESLDLVEIAISSEEKFHISLPEKNFLQTANEIFGAGILEKDGVLTETGKFLMLRRMPELAPKLDGDVTVKDVIHSFNRVSSWVRMIERLMEFTPKVCPQCGAPLRTSIALRMRCKQCGTETPIPSGDELNKKWIQEYYEKEYLPQSHATPLGKPADNPSNSLLV